MSKTMIRTILTQCVFFIVTSMLYAQAPIAAFSPNIQQVGTVPYTISFTDQSTNNPICWLWHFGDGKVDTTQNPSYTYTQTGIYTVSLMASNEGGSSTHVQNALIWVSAETIYQLPDVVNLDVARGDEYAATTRIYGDNVDDESGYSVSSGDVDGDGYEDVIIGAHKADPSGRGGAGETYIIYGSSEMDSETSIDLEGTPSSVTRIYGDDNGDYSGYSVSNGDINGDGFADVIIGAYKADPAGGSEAGETYIIYGSSGMANITSIELNSTPAGVTRVLGDYNSDYSGCSVSSGDINGDGFEDVIIGAKGANPAGKYDAGETYVIYGSSEIETTAIIDLDGSPSNVTRIYGNDGGDYSGYDVSNGDINGDGFEDVIIGARGADPVGGASAGETYIIYGATELDTIPSIDLGGTPSSVTSIYGDNIDDQSGYSVSSGDINGDGYEDVIIGARGADPVGGASAGETYIIYGSSGLDEISGIDLDGNPSNVTRIHGDDEYDQSGCSVSSGDINGDGFEDVIIGAWGADPVGGASAGETYVVYGSSGIETTSNINLDGNPANVTRIYGDDGSDYSGWSVSNGDINGDGYKDVIVGAYGADPADKSQAGETYVIYGGINLPPEIVNNFSVVSHEDSVRLTWDPNLEPDLWYYVLFRSQSPSPTDSIATIYEPGTSYLDLNIQSGESYFYRIVAVDSAGIRGGYSNEINVATIPDPVAAFTPSTQQDGIIPHTIYFTDQSTNNPTSWRWNFGDGQIDTVQNPIHTYTQTGLYSVTLTATNLGGSDTHTEIALVRISAETIYQLPEIVNLVLPTTDRSAKTTHILKSDRTARGNISTGDINGDGISDVMMGYYSTSQMHILYGSSGLENLADIDLNNTSHSVTVINAIETGSSSDPSVSSGDINGDGYADVIIGAHNADPNNRINAGETYIIYGSMEIEGETNINLDGNPSNVTCIYGDDENDRSGYSVSSGDINGDGYTDVIIGAPQAASEDGYQTGEIYIIYGSSEIDNVTSIDLNDIYTTASVTRIYSEGAAGDQAGYSVSGSDINGDGYADVIIGAPWAGLAGEAYIIYGSSGLEDVSGIYLDEDPSNLTRIYGDDNGDLSGYSVSSGDIDSDGYADVIIGAPWADPNASGAGEAYIIYGSSEMQSITTIDLNGTPSNVTRIFGEGDSDQLGWSISCDDINGDSYTDVILGANYADYSGLIYVGATYIIYGSLDIPNIASIDLNESLSNVSRIYGDGNLGHSVSSGDINSDGFADIITMGRQAYFVYGGIDIPPQEVQYLRAESYADSVRLSWHPNDEPDLLYYILYRGINSLPTDSIATIYAGTTSFLDANVNPGDSYFYRIRAVDGARNESVFSEQIVVTVVEPPLTDFLPNQLQTGTVPYTVNFSDLSTNNPTSWIWHFGDGRIDTIQNPSHTYTQTGIFTVSLIAGNAGGGVSEAKQALIWVRAETIYQVPDIVNLDVIPGEENAAVMRIYGDDNEDHSGRSVSSGDINGDGYNDVVIGAYGANPSGGSDAGETYIIYGSSLAEVELGVDLNETPSNVTRIYGDNSDDFSGYNVSSGDINGDGYSDVIIGAYQANPVGRNEAGETYIIYGASGMENISSIDLDESPSNVTRIFGKYQNENSGYSVSSGDINGDGYGDVLIGAVNHWYAGGAYIIYGSSVIQNQATIDLNETVIGATVIIGDYTTQGVGEAETGSSLTSGDINGDGFSDVILGARGARNGAGETIIVYGHSQIQDFHSINLWEAPAPITRLYGGSEEGSGYSVASNDINGDGFGDIVIGAPYHAYAATYKAGKAYIVYGSSDIQSTPYKNLNSFSEPNINRVYGIEDWDYLGTSVSCNDVDGDGYADVIIGANQANPSGRADAGETYIIYGSSNMEIASDYHLSETRANVSRIGGVDVSDFSGTSVSSSDINDDGYADVIIGANRANPSGGTSAGETYVIYGGIDLDPPEPVRDLSVIASEDSIRLNWTENLDSDVWYYVIYRGTSNLQTDSIATILSPATTYLDATVQPGGIYYYRIYAVDSSLNISFPSNEVFITAISPPVAAFSPDIQQVGVVPYTVNFFDQSTNNPTGWTWHFSDGTIDTSQNPTHTFTQTGIFSVILESRNAGGSDTKVQNALIWVHAETIIQLPDIVDLNEASGDESAMVTRIFGDDASDWSGRSVSSGDINGDGYQDVIIGALGADPTGGSNAGETYIIYGSIGIESVASIDLGENPLNVTLIYGDDYGDYSGCSVSSGDINGDGYHDVIIGAYSANPSGGTDAGETYIIYGSLEIQSVASIDLNGSPSNVTRIYGDKVSDKSGNSVSSGDINGDGYHDVIIGAYAANPSSGVDAGETYVVYGSSEIQSVPIIDLNGNPSNVTRIYGDDGSDYSGWSVSNGDINGDGFEDVVVGAYGADPEGGSAAGETYIVYGSAEIGSSTGIFLDGTHSVTRIYGDDAWDESGYSVSTGDINGDGYEDVIVGAHKADPATGANAGEIYIIYGSFEIQSISSIDLNGTLSNMTRINGEEAGDQIGSSISSGDINGDGYTDIIIGAKYADPIGGANAGKTYIIYGAPGIENIENIDLDGSPSNVTCINGDDGSDLSGRSVSSGDVNGDGFSDIIIGAVDASPSGGYQAGETYVVYGGIDITPPSPVSNLTAVANGDSVNLTWIHNPETDIWYYKIYRSIDADLIPPDSLTNVSDTTFSDHDVILGTEYFYWVNAVDSSENESNFTIAASAIPNFPPVWLNPIDIQFDEDDYITLDFNAWVEDQNDHDTTLTISISGGVNIYSMINPDTHVASFWSTPDSSGFTEQLHLTVEDPYGATDIDTIQVSILPVNDPPILINSLDDVNFYEDNYGVIAIERLEDYFVDVDLNDNLLFSGIALDFGLDSLKISNPNQASLNGFIRTSNSKLYLERSNSNFESDSQRKGIIFPREKSNIKPTIKTSSIKATSTNLLSTENGVRDSETDTTSVIIFPTSNFNGDIRIIITATDDSMSSASDTLVVTIIPVNDPPIFSLNADSLLLIEDFEESQIVSVIPGEIAENELNQVVSYSIQSDNAGLADISIDALTGEIQINSVADSNGHANITVVADDGEPDNNLASANLSVTILSSNDTPHISLPFSDFVQVDEDDFGAVVISKLQNHITDIDYGDVLTFSVEVLDPGLDSVALMINDQLTLSFWQFDVNARGLYTRPSNNFLLNDASSNGDDGNSDSKLLSILRDDDLRESDSTSLVVYPTLDFNGEVRIIVTATDDSLASISDTLTLNVNPINDPPILSILPDTSFNEDGTLSIVRSYLYDFVDDTDNLDSTLNWMFEDSDEVLIDLSPSSLFISSQPNWFGVDTVTVQVNDGEFSDITRWVITVLPINDAPGDFVLLSPDDELFVTQTEDTLLTFAWEVSHDVDDDSLEYAVRFTENGFDSLLLTNDCELAVNVEGLPRDVWVQWVVYSTDHQDTTWCEAPRLVKVGSAVGVVESLLLPEEFTLKQNYPNPFNPTTTIRYGLPEASDVMLSVYDILGREVIVLIDGDSHEAGWYDVYWSGLNQTGDTVATGLYFGVLEAGSHRSIIKMMFLK